MGKKQPKNKTQSQQVEDTTPDQANPQDSDTESPQSSDPVSEGADDSTDVVDQATDEDQGGADEVADNSDSDPEDDLSELTTQLTEANEKFLRMVAEHDNYRKRMNGELERTRKYEVANFAREMLEVLESLDRACEIPFDDDALSALDAIREGVELTRKQLMDGLGKFSVEEINPEIGEVFDVNFHQAMTMQPSSEVPANHVVATFRKGYKLHDRLLRPAMVVVASQSDTGAENKDSTDVDSGES